MKYLTQKSTEKDVKVCQGTGWHIAPHSYPN